MLDSIFSFNSLWMKQFCLLIKRLRISPSKNHCPISLFSSFIMDPLFLFQKLRSIKRKYQLNQSPHKNCPLWLTRIAISTFEFKFIKSATTHHFINYRFVKILFLNNFSKTVVSFFSTIGGKKVSARLDRNQAQNVKSGWR
eukprot:Sdes_comp18125_c0_seq1m7584